MTELVTPVVVPPVRDGVVPEGRTVLTTWLELNGTRHHVEVDSEAHMRLQEAGATPVLPTDELGEDRSEWTKAQLRARLEELGGSAPKGAKHDELVKAVSEAESAAASSTGAETPE